MTAIQKTLVTATVAVLAGAGIYEGRQAAQLRNQVQTLQRRQAPLGTQVQQLQRERDDATNQLALLTEEIAKNKKDNLELLRLRGEVGVLRNQLAEARIKATQSLATSPKQVTPMPHRPGTYISKDDLEFAGYSRPEAALESFKWALVKGTLDQANDAIPEDMRDKTISQRDRDDFTEKQATIGKMFTGFQIIAKKVLSEDKVEFKVRDVVDPEMLKTAASNPPPDLAVVPVIKNGDGWRTGGARSYSAEWDADGPTEVFRN